MAEPSDNFRNDAAARMDGALVNALTGLGTSKAKIEHTKVGITPSLGQTEIETLYGYGLTRRIIDCVADEATRELVTIKLGAEINVPENEILAPFEEYLKQTYFHHALSEVVKYQRLYGGGGLLLLCDDGLEPEEPVDESKLRSVVECIPLSRYELIPEDVTITDYSRPEFYRITTSQRLTDQQTASYTNLRVHRSRVARFDGMWLPWHVRSRNNGWGQSVIASIYYALRKYWTAQDGLVEIAQDADLFVHKIPGLFQRVAAGNEADLQKRLEANSLSRSVYGGLAIDTEEDVSYLNRSLAGLKDALDPFLQEIAMALGWPVSILTGESPGGMGKEGRFEERQWAHIVESWQQNYMLKPVTQIFDLILKSKEGPLGGRQLQSWSVNFPSVFVETDKEKADLRQQMAQVDAQYIQLGVLNPLEVRDSRFGQTEYQIETTLNEAVTQQLAVTADQQFESQMMGYEAQRQSYMTPPEENQQGEPSQAEGSTDTQEGAPPEPDNRQKTDSFEVYDAQNIRIRVTHTAGDIKAGHPVAADGQRVDGSATAPVMVLGPHRSRTYKVYRARWDQDGASIDGPYVAAFASLKAARAGVQKIYPRQNGVSLSPVPDGELETLQIGWGTY